MSGITQAMHKLGRRQFLNWCDKGYQYIQSLDQIYSEWLCVPTSRKTTSVKPSGTVSLLCGATPGIHYAHSEYYIRNIRVRNTSPLIDVCKRAGYIVEPDTYAYDTSVVSFPVREKHFDRGKSDVSLWQQFQNAVDIQRHWSDNQVSITATFKPEEAKDLRHCLEAYETDLKAISFLPLQKNGYKQAPYIEITKERYEEMARGLQPLHLDDSVHEVTEKFCTNDTCTL